MRNNQSKRLTQYYLGKGLIISTDAYIINAATFRQNLVSNKTNFEPDSDTESCLCKPRQKSNFAQLHLVVLFEEARNKNIVEYRADK